MAYTIQKVDVWAGTIEDRPGGLAGKLEALAAAGANFEFVIARRDQPGTGVAFVAPLKGAKQTKAASAAGLARAGSLQSLRLEGPDRPGLCAKVSHALADAGINVRGISAAAMGKRCAIYFAFDSPEDAKKAQTALKKCVK